MKERMGWMKEKLQTIIDALCGIEVRGERNLNLLLACIQALRRMTEEDKG